MIVYKDKISGREYNDMRIAVGWKTLNMKQAETGLKNSAYLTVAYDGERYEKYGYTARPNETMGAGMVRWINDD